MRSYWRMLVGSPLLLIAIWVVVSSHIALGISLYTVRTEWGGSPPEGYRANLLSYTLLYFFGFSIIIYAFTSLLSGAVTLITWLLRHQSRWFSLYFLLLNVVLIVINWILFCLVSNRIDWNE